MKIHEYQAKELLKEFNIPVQDGYVLEDVSQAESILDKLESEYNSSQCVVKAQIHAGGVKFSANRESALENIKNILGMTLVTPQTSEEGQLV